MLVFQLLTPGFSPVPMGYVKSEAFHVVTKCPCTATALEHRTGLVAQGGEAVAPCTFKFQSRDSKGAIIHFTDEETGACVPAPWESL